MTQVYSAQGVQSSVSQREPGLLDKGSVVLEPGQIAPDFDLPALIGGVKKRLHLAERIGKQRLVLAFYPLNWEPVSARQMIDYQVQREKFIASGTEVVGISVDSIMNTTAWEREIGPFDYPLCSDFWPHGDICRKYGVLRESNPFAGASERAIFIVGKKGTIEFSKVYPMCDVPELNEVLLALSRTAGAR
jgi:alkyl hydroperoxide reductase subunit AhpC